MDPPIMTSQQEKEVKSRQQLKNYLLLSFQFANDLFLKVLKIGKLLIATVPTIEIKINVSLLGLTEARLNKNSNC